MAAPNNQSLYNKGQLGYEDLVISNLQSGAIDNWTINVDRADFITITVAPAASANILLTVFDETGHAVVDRHDQAFAGEVETITNLSVSEPGTYRIQIAAAPAEPTDYALMVMDSASYHFYFRGTLYPGAPRSDSLLIENDHFWFFSAADGETISLQVTPDDLGDAYVELYGPDGSRLLTLDEADVGEAERLDNHNILATGMYAVRIGEFNFGPMSYQIVVNKT